MDSSILLNTASPALQILFGLGSMIMQYSFRVLCSAGQAALPLLDGMTSLVCSAWRLVLSLIAATAALAWRFVLHLLTATASLAWRLVPWLFTPILRQLMALSTIEKLALFITLLGAYAFIKAKLLRQACIEAAEEFVCQITHEIPIDPVMTEGGDLCEREAAKQYIAHMERNGRTLRSLKTNKPMGKRLVPAIQVKNAIECLITNGAVDSDSIKSWKQRKQENSMIARNNIRMIAETKKKARQGDTNATNLLGLWYWNAMHGLPQDKALSRKWHKRATDMRGVWWMIKQGLFLLFLSRNANDVDYGKALVGIAAVNGFHLFLALAKRLGELIATGYQTFRLNLEKKIIEWERKQH